MIAIITTKPCFHCGQVGHVEVLESDLLRYMSGAFVQEAFPEMPADKREQIITGTHPECWDAMFGGEE